MTDKNNSNPDSLNVYDDGNIPDVDLPQDNASLKNSVQGQNSYNVEPLPESSRPRKDGPGGD